MADISAKLKIHEAGNGTIDHVLTSVRTNNVSELPFATDIISWVNNTDGSNKYCQGNKVNPLGLFEIGSSSKGFIGAKNYENSQSIPSENYKGVMFGYTNASSQFALTLTFQGNDMGKIMIVFDKQENNYPTSYTYTITKGTTTSDPITINDNTSTKIIIEDIDGNATQFYISFNAWKKANSIVGITFIENQVIDVMLDKSYITSFETQNQITSNPQEAGFGVLANTGTIKLKDKNNYLLGLAEKGYLKMNSFGVEIYVNGKMIQKHIVVDNPYYSADGSMEISLTNAIEKMTNIIPQKTYSAGTTLYAIFSDIMTQSGYEPEEIDNMLQEYPFGYIIESPEETPLTFKYLFQNSTIERQMVLEQGTLREQIQKICQATRSYFYQNDDGQLTFTRATVGAISNFQNGLQSTYKDQISRLAYDILTSNQYDAVVVDDTDETSNGRNILNYGTNEFLKADLKFGEPVEPEPGEEPNLYNFYDYYKNKIKNYIPYEYQLGIKTATIDLIPITYYHYENIPPIEVPTKDWSKGEMFNTGEVIMGIEGSPKDIKSSLDYQWYPDSSSPKTMLWRIMSRLVKYDGQVTLSLTLRECMYGTEVIL